ncbi:hypothetical protein PKHYL_26710 [Psychrobacter sp. KH172YL61]|uniref:hypothetical protein n=1 Tax=Psychrobacter sp. KH172YL61 TaxID=2517899 RepID=UPI0010B3E7D5|nr:hypothetical protein [Psychrobacter sp. KH172YL61]BBI68480.1 hypothetical protein PKHYL_26710 [Psychrobacter sp. KH172YL61]
MPAYKYLGCVTAFSENGNTQLIQPSEIPMPINRSENSYTERLLGILLLIVDESVVPKRFWASKPYPALVEREDAYQPTVKPLNITLKRILKDTTIDSDAYMPSVKPLDITLRSLLMRKDIDENDAYMPSVKPLDITLKSLLMSKNIDGDAYIPSVKPLDITLKRVLIEHIVDDKDAYIPSVKPLDITLKTGA